MRNYIILNGTNSNTINGLLIQSLAPISKPLMRTEIEEIDGRDGDIVTPLGFSAYDKDITIGLYGTFDINQIIAFFNSEGTVVFSNEPDKYYNYQITAQIDFERLVRYRTATVTFRCQPFKFATTGETQLLDGGEAISGEGSAIVLDGTAEAPFNKLDLEGNAEQQTFTGKNLLNTNALGRTLPYTTTSHGVTFKLDVDGSVTLNGQNDGTANSTFSFYTAQVPFVSIASSYTGDINPTDGVYRGAEIIIYDGTHWRGFTHNSTQTVDAGNCTMYLQVVNGNTTQFSNYKVYPMIELGTTKSDYEPYVGSTPSAITPSPNPDYPQGVQVVTGENTVKIEGKNLLTFADKIIGGSALDIQDRDSNSLTFTPAVGATQYANRNVSYMLTELGLKAGDVITVSADITGTYATDGNKPRIRIYGRDTSTALATALSPNDSARTLTIPDSTDRIQLYFYVRDGQTPAADSFATFANVQIELGERKTEFEPYQGQSYTLSLGSLELAKIGDYADKPVKVGDTWYIRRAFGKIVFDGSNDEFWQYTSGDRARFFIAISDLKKATNQYDIIPMMSDYFISASVSQIYNRQDNSIAAHYDYNQMWLSYHAITSVNDFKTWLSTHNTTVYYALATPVDEEITDATLIEQLEAINSQAHAYRGRTHIFATATGTNAPHIIAAEVNGDASGTVTNAGNIYSKPKLTVYGSGDIGIYLNGVQMFQVALGSDGYITIDTALMEAYKDNLQTLKNRQVTGDYSNFKLPVGQNTISFSGVVSKCIVENFSRWL